MCKKSNTFSCTCNAYVVDIYIVKYTPSQITLMYSHYNFVKAKR